VNVPSPLIVAPQGTPAITTVVTTGRRYRGTIELRRTASGVRVINHVSLEDYVAGIAEEKGAGWPLEGMKALAVAARTLGAATMTWLGAHHADGYDICPTDNCQVYLGYDGEEAIMREAVDETAGEIRMYNGSPILAMYHGNGGGQTQSYKDLTNDAGDPYPYLVSVKYPFADPWHWTVKTTLHDVADALSKDGVTIVPSPLKYVIVLKRGETPRVKRVGLFDDTPKGIALNGAAFAHALGLPSNWFYVHLPHKPPRSYDAAFIGQIDTGPPDLPVPAQRAEPWALRLLAGALAAAAALSGWTANGGPATAWKRARRVARIPRRLSAAPDVL
jgi:stage II sporulation protein D